MEDTKDQYNSTQKNDELEFFGNDLENIKIFYGNNEENEE